MDELKNKIINILQKRKEKVVLDLYLRDYDCSNYYFAIVYNSKIEKFKVLMVPLDAIDDSKYLEEYFCYQFIFVKTVENIMKEIHDNEEIIERENINYQSTLDSYYIEINTHIASKDYCFKFSQYIPTTLPFFFNIMVLLFEHLPNIVSELCNKILYLFQNPNDAIRYNGSYSFNLYKDSFLVLFTEKIVNNCKYLLKDVSFLERVGNKYYAVINNEWVCIHYIDSLNKMNIYSGQYPVLGEEIFIVLQAIIKEKFHSFYHLSILDEDEVYLCYGFSNGNFLVVSSLKRTISIRDYSYNNISLSDYDEVLIKKIEEYLSERYEDFKVKEILQSILDE